MKFSISLFSFCILSFILVLSCSTEEVQDTTPPPSIIQTPQPETPAPIQYTLSVSSGDGGTVSSEGGTYDEGTDITLTATPNGEYIFSNWSNGSTDNPISFELNSDTNLTANFEKRKYALTINISGEGTVTEEIIETDKSTDYDSGTKVKLTAVPSEGWVFRSWGELIENQELSFEIIIDEPKEVNVVFDEIVEEGYFSVNYEGNGTFIRYGAPYPPLKSYGVELIEGEVNDDGEYLNGSTLRFTYQNNPGWFLSYFYKRENYTEIPEMAVINDFNEFKWREILEGEPFVINENIYIPINVATTMDTFPYDQEFPFGIFPKVGQNTDLYPEWNEPSNEYNWYVTNNFSWPGYVEAYKDRLFQITQVVGDFGPLDILIFDWEENPENNREMYQKTREGRAAAAYQNQLISSVQNWVESEMEYYDEAILNNGWPFGSADAMMGVRKQIGSIFKNKYIEYIDMWSNNSGLAISDLINSNDFHWEWETGAYHEYIHIWQASQNKHGFINEIGGCHNCNVWTERDPNLNKIWIAPRWFQEGQCAVIQSILSEKMQLRAEQGHCCTIPPPIFKVRDYIEKYLLNNNLDKLRRDETDINGYYTIGEAASFYKFAKMNYSMETFMAFEVHRGTFGYASALQEFLGVSEDDFYDEFNNWFFDSSITDNEKLNYLFPEGTDPIQIDIQSRR